MFLKPKLLYINFKEKYNLIFKILKLSKSTPCLIDKTAQSITEIVIEKVY